MLNVYIISCNPLGEALRFIIPLFIGEESESQREKEICESVLELITL